VREIHRDRRERSPIQIAAVEWADSAMDEAVDRGIGGLKSVVLIESILFNDALRKSSYDGRESCPRRRRSRREGKSSL
jgi:hypothetical protein